MYAGLRAVGVAGEHGQRQWERVAGSMLPAVAWGQSSLEELGLSLTQVLSKAGTAAVLAGSQFPGAVLRAGQLLTPPSCVLQPKDSPSPGARWQGTSPSLQSQRESASPPA